MQKYAKEEGQKVKAYLSYNVIMETILFKLHNVNTHPTEQVHSAKLVCSELCAKVFLFLPEHSSVQSHHHQPKSCSFMNALYLQ